jgi:diguanylate cyclase (GGDEF)-like protein
MKQERTENYYQARCRDMDEQLREMRLRFRNALGDVRRAKVTTRLIRRLYRLDYLKLGADELAASFIDQASSALELPRAAIFRRSENGTGFECIRAHGFVAPEGPLLAHGADRDGFVFSGSFDTDIDLVRDVRAMTGARHFVWCYSRVSRLGVLFANGVDGHDDAWEFGLADEPMVESVLDVVGSVMQRAKVEQQLAHHAFHDSLTGLPNRGLLLRHLDACVQRSQREARDVSVVLFLDIDRFKWVNDTLGHLAGDKLLVAVAQRLRATVRPGDLVARLSGDEFAVLTENLSTIEDARALAQRILETLATPFRIHGDSVYASLSIGLAEARPGHTSAADFLRDADVAMYHAKRKGGARLEVFGNEMSGRGVGDLRLQGDLRQALAREEMSLYYQPIFDVKTGKVESLEALLRWHHPREGLLSPERFGGLLEQTGLMSEMGDWALQRVARDINLWRSESKGAVDVKVCVNIAQSQFVRADFVTMLTDVLRRYCIAPGQLRLELTESTLLDCRTIDEQVLEQLGQMGVRIMLDDFGTGYSSLSRLQSLPIDTIKIDRSLVQQLGGTAEQGQLVQAIMAMAENLGLGVVAEGAETPAQLDALRQLGCDGVQGYLLGRPMAASRVSRYMVNQKAASGDAVVVGA